MAETKPIRPQAGPQEDFLSTEADIAIFGGAAYGGKSFALLMESTRHIDDARYNGVIFRRESPQITSGGGLWDTASQIYPNVGGEPKEHKLTYVFPQGSYVKFTHLQHESDKLNHQGAQYVFIGFDELTHFTEGQFWYLLTRNRPPSGCNIRPYCRCTTNPESNSWVRELILWWIDEETGYAIKERSGVIRYFTRIDDKIIWVNKDWKDSEGNGPKSITFIPSYIDDNPAGMEADPTYKSNLMAQDKVNRERLLFGNWNITYKGGMFNPEWFRIVNSAPKDVEWVRYWDRAATEAEKEDDDPDWTAGALVGMYGGELYIKDIVHFRDTPAINERKIKDTATNDGIDVSIGYEVEPGSSGKEVGIYYQTKVLKGYTVQLDHPKGNKIERCKPWCALAEHGHVYLVKGDWNRVFLAEAGGFPFGKKDQIDAVSGGYKMLTLDKYVWPMFKKSDATDFRMGKLWRYYINIGGIYLGKDMKMSFLCGLWSREQHKLYIYGEVVSDQRSLSGIASDIFTGMKMEYRSNSGIMGNDAMFKDEKKSTSLLLNREIHNIQTDKRAKKSNVIKEPYMYDRMGTISLVNLMFHRGEIVVHTACEESSRQFASWYIDKGKPSSEGFELCEALCQIVSELNRTENLKIPMPQPRDYKPIDRERKKKEKKSRWMQF